MRQTEVTLSMNGNVSIIAGRHVGKCLGSIEDVHDLPEACKSIIRKHINQCADDVCDCVVQSTKGKRYGNNPNHNASHR